MKSLKAGLFAASVAGLAVALSACSELPSAGPTASAVLDSGAAEPTTRPYEVIDVDPSNIGLLSRRPLGSFAARFGDHRGSVEPLIGVGDMLAVTIWEASSGGLFSSPAALERVSAGANSATIPDQVVGRDGSITVPYAGRIEVAGRTPRSVQQVIQHALEGKAIQPQVLVTDNKPISSTVAIGGEGVAIGQRIPLSVKGDRVLDVIAEAGGIKLPVNEIIVVLQRGGVTERVPLQRISADSRENIYLRPGDAVTLVRDPQTFLTYGATAGNAEIPFGTDQLTLAQALVKSGGVNDYRSDKKGLFVFRMERPEVVRALRPDSALAAQNARVPVVYHFDNTNPNTLFMEQRFQIASRDLIYISNAPSVELMKAIDLFNGIAAPLYNTSAAAASVSSVK